MKELRVGDVVRVKSWERLKSEFGRGAFGGIDCNGVSFVSDMREWCGKELQITSIEKRRNGTNAVYFIDSEITDRWHITTDMLELVDDEELDVDAKQLDEFLSAFGNG